MICSQVSTNSFHSTTSSNFHYFDIQHLKNAYQKCQIVQVRDFLDPNDRERWLQGHTTYWIVALLCLYVLRCDFELISPIVKSPTLPNNTCSWKTHSEQESFGAYISQFWKFHFLAHPKHFYWNLAAERLIECSNDPQNVYETIFIRVRNRTNF